MTETQRLIENERALDLAKQEVAKVESEISRLGRLEEDLHECRESIEKLLAENTKIRINQDAIDKTKRMARLRDNAATIDLETVMPSALSRILSRPKPAFWRTGRSHGHHAPRSYGRWSRRVRRMLVRHSKRYGPFTSCHEHSARGWRAVRMAFSCSNR